MSDSDLSDAPSTTIPSDSQLEKSLREEVRKAAKAEEEYTVRTIRTASEQKLDLSPGFYKSHEVWKDRSSTIIKAEADAVKEDAGKKSPPKTTPKVVKASAPAKKAAAPKRAPKRATSDDSPQPRKKAKASSDEVDSDSLSSLPSDVDEDLEESAKEPVKKNSKPKTKDSVKPKPKPKPRAKKKEVTSDEEDQSLDEVEEKAPAKNGAASDSEVSILLDEEPAKKKRSKSKDLSDQKSGKTKTTKPKPTDDADPDKEEIKKLQGWLVKCGIRKVWGKELKPYETSKAKIKHLKEMLADVGMTGRFSNEKAASIKEARELAADIEAVQEGAERWGKNDDDDEDDDGDENKTRAGRRLVRGAKNYDFLSSDGEETD